MRQQRERRCIVTRAVLPEEQLIRMALSPDGEVGPDVSAKLPGRGAWVSAKREAIDAAVKKNLFARAFERAVQAPDDLADRVEALLCDRCLSHLGMARRSGGAAAGFDQAHALVKSGGAACVLEAADGAEDGRGKILALLRAMDAKAPVVGCFTAEELGAALGRDAATHVALAPGPHAAGLLREAGRLAGFRRLAPETWRLRDD